MNTILNEILDKKIIAIVRGIDSKDILKTAEALYDGGVRCIEVTFKPYDKDGSENTINSINTLSSYFKKDLRIGAGTVLSKNDVKRAFEAGAEFIISPNVDVDVIKYTKTLGMISLPGAYTPTEAQIAFGAGADIIKIFPAGQLTPKYFKAVKDPMRYLKLAAVGGISVDNIEKFLIAGADAFGIGSNLVNRKRVENKEWDTITSLAKQYERIIKKYKSE